MVKIRRQLRTRWLGHDLVYLSSTTSTNDVARQAANDGKPEGLVVLAEQQSQGRGRLSRPWHAPAGTSILLSLLLRPTFPPLQLFCLTMLTASAAAAAIERVTDLPCHLKWPNDLQIRNRKVGGILTEAALAADRIDFAIVGLGINVNVASFPPELANATSLLIELGKPVERPPLICCLLDEIEARYEIANSGQYAAIAQEWRSRLTTLGKEVIVTDGQWTAIGLAYDVDLDGTLLLRYADGSSARIVTGDITLRHNQ